MVASMTETFWWWAVSNKIHFTKLHSLFFFAWVGNILKSLMPTRQNQSIYTRILMKTKHPDEGCKYDRKYVIKYILSKCIHWFTVYCRLEIVLWLSSMAQSIQRQSRLNELRSCTKVINKFCSVCSNKNAVFLRLTLNKLHVISAVLYHCSCNLPPIWLLHP
jgi:hypothetical protein